MGVINHLRAIRVRLLKWFFFWVNNQEKYKAYACLLFKINSDLEFLENERIRPLYGYPKNKINGFGVDISDLNVDITKRFYEK